MRIVARKTPDEVFDTPPRPADVRQSRWHNTCYILSSFQTICAQYPDHITRMLAPGAHGTRVRHFGTGHLEWMLPKEGPRFWPAATIAAGCTHVPDSKEAPSRRWWTTLRHAYLATTGRGLRFRGFPERVLFWALGCGVQAALLPQGAARAGAVGDLARMFTEGECIVLFVGDHCWSLIGAARQADGWHVTVSDPRSLRPEARVLSEASREWSRVHAYAVTLGAAAAVKTFDARVTHFLLDKTPQCA